MMATLFIANPTKQNNHFFYKLAEVNRLLDEVIPYGEQVQIAKHLNPTQAQLQAIIEQHAVNGLVDVREVTSRHKGKFTLVYSWDKPVNFEKLSLALERNDNESLKIADESREIQTESLVKSLSEQTGKEPESISITLSEQTTEAGRTKTRVVREVGRNKKAA
jgi:hypothetical protein